MRESERERESYCSYLSLNGSFWMLIHSPHIDTNAYRSLLLLLLFLLPSSSSCSWSWSSSKNVDANLDKTSGGLVIYTKKPPPHWTFEQECPSDLCFALSHLTVPHSRFCVSLSPIE